MSLRVGIIGAGLSGRLLAINLLRLAERGQRVEILLFDTRDERSVGPAYSDQADYLLLNVPAGRMSGTSENPEQFLKWARDRGVRAGEFDFLPRRLYRDYILTLMDDALLARSDSVSFEYVRGEVTDVVPDDRGAVIHVNGRSEVNANRVSVNKVVLAVGNFPPPDLPIDDRSALDSRRYVRNPWDTRILDAIGPRDTVLLVGSGQTTVDLIVALHRRAHEGRIVALSRHGRFPLAHRGFETYEPFFDEMKDSGGLLGFFRTVRRHMERADAVGVDRRAVIDSLRPYTRPLWMSLSVEDKRRFMRHVFRLWEVIRARIPPQSDNTLSALRASGQLEVVAGRIRALVETPTALEVHYNPRGHSVRKVEAAALVVNCVGPECDYRKVEHPLVRNLLRRGVMRPGPANLAMDAAPSGALIGQGGQTSRCFYTLGSTMRGVLWEVLAVQEIRAQAEELAPLLLDRD